MNFEEFLEKTANEIDLEIEAFFTEWNKEVEHISSRFLPYVKALRDSCTGGKRLRGMLVKLSFESSWGKPNRDILRVAVAYEIFQTAILAHDDIIDHSLLRRGKPSLYSRLGADHDGISKAICLGDIGFFLAYRIIADTDFTDSRKNKVIAVFSKAMSETGLGELLDVVVSNSNFCKSGKELGIDEVKKVYELKTANYTISAPLVIGGVLGGAKNEQIYLMEKFGLNLGIAFQIKDDLNDIFGVTSMTGKELGGDIKEGKRTILYLLARQMLDKKQREFLDKYYGNSEIGKKEIEKLKEIFENCGAVAQTRNIARKHTAMAMNFFEKMKIKREYTGIFAEMVEFLGIK